MFNFFGGGPKQNSSYTVYTNIQIHATGSILFSSSTYYDFRLESANYFITHFLNECEKVIKNEIKNEIKNLIKNLIKNELKIELKLQLFEQNCN